jgi:tetratricopeptide (TPR) repeat protein
MNKGNLAKGLLTQQLAENQGDPGLLKLQYLLLLRLEDFKGAIAAGEEWVAADTAAADTVYFERLARAYLADSQKTKAADAARRGIAKFPKNQTLLTLYPPILAQDGKTQEAIAAWRAAAAAGVPATTVNAQVLRLYIAMNQPDSLFALLREMRADPANADLVSGVALQQGNTVRKVCDETKAVEPCTRAITWLAFSDSVKATPDAKFLIGATAFTYGMQKLQDANKSRSCDEAKVAQDMLLTAQINVPAGGSKYPDNARTLMGYLTQYAPSADQMVKTFCKTAKGASGNR